ncbi:MAG: hypothetical protein L3K06_05165 [Thermoplasmata archaeon]|nr:hypothetical protein [Thermoplasmata archaeon]
MIASARADRLTWVAYPKGGQLGTDLSRDRVWRPLLSRGIQPVTCGSIDTVWTGRGFRPSGTVRSSGSPGQRACR